MIGPPRSSQTSSMVRVLTRLRGWELALSASLLTAATVAACAGKALDVGSEELKGNGGTGAGGSTAAHGGAFRNQPRTLSPEELAASQWPADTACVAAPGTKLGSWKGHWPDPQTYPEADVVLHLAG